MRALLSRRELPLLFGLSSAGLIAIAQRLETFGSVNLIGFFVRHIRIFLHFLHNLPLQQIRGRSFVVRQFSLSFRHTLARILPTDGRTLCLGTVWHTASQLRFFGRDTQSKKASLLTRPFVLTNLAHPSTLIFSMPKLPVYELLPRHVNGQSIIWKKSILRSLRRRLNVYQVIVPRSDPDGIHITTGRG